MRAISSATSTRARVAPPPPAPGQRRDLTLDPGTATLLGVPLSFGLLASVVLPYQLAWGSSPIKAAASGGLTLFIGGLLLGIVVHEGLHAIVWRYTGRLPRPVVRFGVNRRMLMPYAHPVGPVSVGTYRLGALAPGVIMGFIPALAGLIIGSAHLAGWGALFSAFAVGDLMVVFTLRGVPSHSMVQDHPTRVGCELLLTSYAGMPSDQSKQAV